MRAETMRRVVSLIGTARPRPMPATAVLTPTSRPRPSTRAPPELPGLRAASVWITSSTIRLAEPAPVAQAAADLEASDRRDDQLGDRRDDRRVGVEGGAFLFELALAFDVEHRWLLGLGAFGAHLAHLHQGVLELADPLALVLAHEAHAPGQRVAAAAGHATAHEGVE